jgi:glyoxylase-like metal-dependent hydrolase (beta-lactamase superfamily II)
LHWEDSQLTELSEEKKEGQPTMEIRAFYHQSTSTLTYAVWDSKTRDAVIIDPVLDYDPAASVTWTESVEEVIGWLNQEKLKLHYVLETHAHADHLSGSQVLKRACPNVKVAIGRRIILVQEVFKQVFGFAQDFPTNGRQFDVLLEEGEPLLAGSLAIETLFTPGHTPACTTLKVGDAMFTGDALFMPDSGSGRCDFPGGSANDLYDSITQRIYTQPDSMRIFVGHDYQPGGRELRYQTTVGEQKQRNVALSAATTRGLCRLPRASGCPAASAQALVPERSGQHGCGASTEPPGKDTVPEDPDQCVQTESA